MSEEADLPRTRNTVSRWQLGLAALFASALLWKLYCLRRLASSLLFPILSADSAAYWGWAHVIQQQGWVGRNPFFLGPLYPYLLAALGLNGPSPLPALIGQCILGAASVVLIACATECVSSRRSALFVGLLAAGYSLATFFDVSLLSESLLWFLGSALLLLELRLLAIAPSRMSVAAGCIIGLMSLARPSCWLLVLPHAIASMARLGWRRGVYATLTTLSLVGLLCIPTLARHLALGHGWVPITYSLGYNFYIGNGSSATGAYSSIVDDAGPSASLTAEVEGGIAGDGRRATTGEPRTALSASASSAYWLERGIREIAQSPGHFMRLLSQKALLSLNVAEASQIDNLGVYERIFGPYGLPLMGTFGIVGVLGLFGLLSCLDRTTGRTLAAFFVAAWLPMILFFVTDRYRIQTVLPLLVACGPAIDRLTRLPSTSQRSRLMGAALLCGVCLLVWLPVARYESARVEFETHRTVAELLIEKGEFDRAEAEMHLCLAPAILEKLPLQRMRTARTSVADAYRMKADLLARRGSYSECEQALRAAASFAPDLREVRIKHVLALAVLGSGDRALAEAAGLGLEREDIEAMLLRSARDAAQQGEWTTAETTLRAAVAVDSSSEVANVVLVRLLHSQGREADARAILKSLPARGISDSVIARESRALAHSGGAPDQ